MEITKKVLYAALTRAATWIEGNNDDGCEGCPVNADACKQTPFAYCVTNVIHDMIELGIELVEHEPLDIGK